MDDGLEKWLSEMEAETVGSGEGILFRDLREKTGIGEDRLRNLLRKGVEAGKVECKNVMVKSINGVMGPRCVYFFGVKK